MQQKIEGLILRKTPLKERDLVVQLLLRSGRVVTVCFYGGQGGGKKARGSLLEVGHMVSVTLSLSRTKRELYSAKEWKLIWHYEKIRLDIRAFQLMCLYIELISKLALEDDLYDEYRENDDEQVGLFRVLSNGIFHMERALNNGNFIFETHLALYLGRLLVELGFFPERMNCVVSGQTLEDGKEVVLIPEHGGFADLSAINASDEFERNPVNDTNAWKILGVVFHHSFDRYEEVPRPSLGVLQKVFDYLLYQIHFSKTDLKTVQLLGL